VPAAPASFLDPVLLARISDLALLARTVVDGFMHGQHRSMRKGSSTDFAQHRPYQPGDDLRRVDWRLLGRTDRFYMKEFEADTNASVIFALDSSASMDYGSKGVTKYDYGRFLIASLAWLSQAQGDRVGLATFTGDIVDVVPPSARHLQLLLHTLGRSKATGAGSLATPVQRLAHMTARAGITVLVTDCYESPEELGRCADALRMRGQDLIIFHVVDAAERDFPFTAAATFEDSESKTRIAVRPDDLRKRYLEQARAHHAAVAKRLVASGADYVRVDTDQPLDRALHAYLDDRLARSRVR
jgi:uncharacterized protein (DUF58 family)